MIDLENDFFQAHCQIDYLQNYLEEGATIRHVRDNVVTMDLPDGSFTKIYLHPVQELLDKLRTLK